MGQGGARLRPRRSPGRAELAFDLGDPLLVALVEGPLLDPRGPHEPRLRQDPQMLARGGLADTELGGDEHTAHPIAHEIAVDLTRKVRARRLEPAEDLQPLLVRQRLGDVDRKPIRHFANWLSPVNILGVSIE